MSYNVEKIRKLFPWFDYNQNRVYLDNAATTLKPKSVIQAYDEYFCKFGTNPHNVNSAYTYQLKAQLEGTRKKVAKFLDCSDEAVVFTASATESLNLFAFGLRDMLAEGDNVVVPEAEHSSNLLPWYELAKLTGVSLRIVKFENVGFNVQGLLAAIDQNTKIVSFSNCNNLLGFKCNAAKVTHQIKQRFPHVIVCVDATQYVQHHRLKLNAKSGIDFCAFSMHKLYGPTGVGVAYVDAKWRNILFPLKLGGGCFADYSNDPLKMFRLLETTARFEAGTPNISGIYAVSATIDFLNSLDWKLMHDHEINLAKKLVRELKKIPHIKVMNPQIEAPMVSFICEGIPPQDVANYLGNHNIIVRAGNACAPLLCQAMGYNGFVRVSFGCYNTMKEVNYLVKKMRSFKSKHLIF